VTETADVVVIGAGVMGAATAWRLTLMGRRPVVLEQFEVGHSRGSSHGVSRVFRLSYGDPMYVRMAIEALPLWRELEQASGRSILTSLGQLDWGQPFVDQNERALREAGAAFEMFEGEEANRRYPVSVPARETVLFHPDAGIVRAEDSVRTFLDMAAAGGAEVRERTRVVELRPAGDRVDVVAEGETYRAAVVVVTAGPWLKPLAETAGIDLPVVPSIETVVYLSHPDEMALPVLVEWGEHIVYGLPDPGRGIKVGAHHSGPDTEPDDEHAPDPALVEMLAAWAGRHYPKADLNEVRAETCLYTNTSDERFLLERLGPIVIGSACSGHAFKFAPLIGERLAALARG
jgi:sarcosine oxidase